MVSRRRTITQGEMGEVEQLLERINNRHGTAFGVLRRYEGGENQGAYLVLDPGGEGFALKWDRHPQHLPRLWRARQITDRLRSLGAPVPEYRLIDTFPDGYTYWLQTALPGSSPETLTEGQLQDLLKFIDLQAGQAISHEQDWSAYVEAVVFEGESGWIDSLRLHSATTRELLGRLERLVAGKRACCRNVGDIVHGDLGPGNVLVNGEQVSGIVDWDAAGCGDRVLDLTKLLYYSYANPPIRERLKHRVLELTDGDTLVVYLAYAILSQLEWSIHHHSLVDVYEGVRVAHSILRDVEDAQ